VFAAILVAFAVILKVSAPILGLITAIVEVTTVLRIYRGPGFDFFFSKIKKKWVFFLFPWVLYQKLIIGPYSRDILGKSANVTGPKRLFGK